MAASVLDRSPLWQRMNGLNDEMRAKARSIKGATPAWWPDWCMERQSEVYEIEQRLNRTYCVAGTCLRLEYQHDEVKVEISDGELYSCARYFLDEFQAHRCFVKAVAVLARSYRDLKALGWADI